MAALDSSSSIWKGGPTVVGAALWASRQVLGGPTVVGAAFVGATENAEMA